METLRISPKYTSDDWTALDKTDATHWPKAIAIVQDRLHGRFLHFADKCLKEDYSGFVVLSIDCLLVETIQQFIEGETDGRKKSERCFRRFLAGPRFRSDFKPAKTRKIFYSDIRCGLLHQAEAKNKWLIRRKQPTMLKIVGTDGYIIDVERFHKAIQDSLDDYVTLLSKAESTDLRDKLWTKMDHICNARTSRGAMETLYAAAVNPPLRRIMETARWRFAF
jgi:hypothetical protein